MSLDTWGDEVEDPQETNRLLTMTRFQAVHAELMLCHTTSNNETTSHHPSNKNKCPRKKKRKRLWKDSGTRTTLTPKQSTWYILYAVNGDDMDKTELKDFRNRFRLLYENFKQLLQ